MNNIFSKLKRFETPWQTKSEVFLEAEDKDMVSNAKIVASAASQ